MSEFETLSRSSNETYAFGLRLAPLLQAGDVLVLTGDLGAGKTQLTKGVAAGMGVDEPITSPTFNIMLEYEGAKMPLYHFDLYRLEDPDELGDAGVLDVLGGDGPCLIEWGEQFADELGDDRLDVFVERADGEAGEGVEPARRIRLVAHGPRAQRIVSALTDN